MEVFWIWHALITKVYCFTRSAPVDLCLQREKKDVFHEDEDEEIRYILVERGSLDIRSKRRHLGT